MWELLPPNNPIPPRDQPAFMIALRAQRELNSRKEPKGEKDIKRNMFLQHVDIPNNVFCRRRTTPEGHPLVCGGHSSCLLAHKPDQKVEKT